ncbi:hypothetical protein VNI00_015629 [Paramarasmius palmivorus]|uniref:Uncharacterized protein n=1 Tax=Paramarasmius palmivorus TaxID=297713 RepID=A0AAW0BK58_9AGAR
MNLGRLLNFVSTIASVLFFVFYALGFLIVAPPFADVDHVNNVAGNWTWFEGEITKVAIHLVVHNPPDICIYGKTTPIANTGIMQAIEGAVEINGRKHGTVIFQAAKIGEYILCAYQDDRTEG